MELLPREVQVAGFVNAQCSSYFRDIAEKRLCPMTDY